MPKLSTALLRCAHNFILSNTIRREYAQRLNGMNGLSSRRVVTSGKVIVSLLYLALLMGCATYRKDEASIRQDLLNETPLGTTFEEVEAKLKRKYTKVHPSPHVGFLKMVNTREELVGSKSISVDLGSYRTGVLETTSDTAFWGFNESGKLIEIWVRKYRDSL